MNTYTIMATALALVALALILIQARRERNPRAIAALLWTTGLMVLAQTIHSLSWALLIWSVIPLPAFWMLKNEASFSRRIFASTLTLRVCVAMLGAFALRVSHTPSSTFPFSASTLVSIVLVVIFLTSLIPYASSLIFSPSKNLGALGWFLFVARDGLILTQRLYIEGHTNHPILQNIFITTGLLIALYGALRSLVQTDLQKFVVYMGVSHTGFFALAMFADPVHSTTYGFLYGLSSTLSLTACFAVTRLLIARLGQADFRSLHGIVHSAPVLSWTMFGLILATMGFPGTLGFVAEDLLGRALYDISFLACATGLAAMLLNAMGWMRIFTLMFLGPQSSPVLPATIFATVLARERLALILLALPLFFFGFWPSLILRAFLMH